MSAVSFFKNIVKVSKPPNTMTHSDRPSSSRPSSRPSSARLTAARANHTSPANLDQDEVQVIEPPPPLPKATPQKPAFSRMRTRKNPHHPVSSRRLEINGVGCEAVDDATDLPLGATTAAAPRRNLASVRGPGAQPFYARHKARSTPDLRREHRPSREHSRDRLSSSRPPLRRSDRQKIPPLKGNAYNIAQVHDDRRRRESANGPRSRSRPASPPTPPTLVPPQSKSPVIYLDQDDDSDDAVEVQNTESPPTNVQTLLPVAPEPHPTPRYSTRQQTSKADRVELDRDEVEEEVKNLDAVDAPYDGPTNIIFLYPRSKIGRITVTAEERGRLKGQMYLNDSLIDFYVKYLEQSWHLRPCNANSKTKFFSSFFFGVLGRSKPINYFGVERWTKGVDLFATQFVFVPICDSYHWSLIIIANLDALEDRLEKLDKQDEEQAEDAGDLSRMPRIIYLDSLDPKRGTEFGETIRRYLVEEWLCRKKREKITDSLRQTTFLRFRKAVQLLKPNVPIQSNEYDCGLYLLKSLVMFLENFDDFRGRLLRGERAFRDCYNHCDVQKLRKSIVALMDILEEEWAAGPNHPYGDMPMHPLEGSHTLNNPAENAVEGKSAVEGPAVPEPSITIEQLYGGDQVPSPSEIERDAEDEEFAFTTENGRSHGELATWTAVESIEAGNEASVDSQEASVLIGNEMELKEGESVLEVDRMETEELECKNTGRDEKVNDITLDQEDDGDVEGTYQDGYDRVSDMKVGTIDADSRVRQQAGNGRKDEESEGVSSLNDDDDNDSKSGEFEGAGHCLLNARLDIDCKSREQESSTDMLEISPGREVIIKASPSKRRRITVSSRGRSRYVRAHSNGNLNEKVAKQGTTTTYGRGGASSKQDDRMGRKRGREKAGRDVNGDDDMDFSFTNPIAERLMGRSSQDGERVGQDGDTVMVEGILCGRDATEGEMNGTPHDAAGNAIDN